MEGIRLFPRKYRITCLFIALIYILISINFIAVAEDKAFIQNYSLDAENIIYSSSGSIISATGDVIFKTDGLAIKTDQIIIALDENTVTTNGDKFQLITEDKKISGKNLQYNYKKKVGTLYGSESRVDDLNFKGEKIELVEKKDYDSVVSKASFTKCILDDPHYQLKAERLMIYPNNKVVAKNVSFFWGNIKLFYLPSYVMEYTKNEKTGKEKLGSSSPVPNIAYNTEDGLIFELDYPYEIADNSTGKAYMNVVQKGSQHYSINHTHRFNQKTVWQGDYSYDKDVEKTDQVQDDITLEKSFNSNLEYSYNKNLSFFNRYNYSFEKENDLDPDIAKDGSVGFQYNKNALSLLSTLGYDFVARKRSEIINFTYSLPYSHTFKLNHDYRKEKLKKELYKLYSTGNGLDWSLKYKKGYDIDYLPYLSFDLKRLYGFKTDFGLGKVSEGDKEFEKIRFDLAYKNSVDLTDNIYFSLLEKYIHHQYKDTVDYLNSQYRGILSNLKVGADYNLDNGHFLGGAISWKKNITKGDYLISDDEIEEKDIIQPELNLGIKTSQPESYFYLKNSSEYDLNTEEWNKVKFILTRKLDCHSFSFSYEMIEKAFAIQFSMF